MYRYCENISTPAMLCILTVVFLSLAACTTVAESARDEKSYDREDRLLQAKDDFQARAEQCKKTGGIMYTRQHYSSRLHEMDAHDYRTAECVKHLAKGNHSNEASKRSTHSPACCVCFCPFLYQHT